MGDMGLEAAASLLRAALPPARVEHVPLVGAEGRVLARPVQVARPVPAYPLAAMDGFAVVAADLAGASHASPVDLVVVGESLPGRPYGKGLQRGQAVAVATGAPLPRGADAVVRWEEVREVAPGRVRICRPVTPGRHVAQPGEDLAPGACALPAGTVLGPAELALLALAGVHQRLPVLARPRVAVLCTGSELVEPAERAGAYRVPNAGGLFLRVLIRQLGALPIYLGIAPDDPAAIARRLAAAPEADLLVTTGGASRGRSDRLAEAAALLGATVLFQRLRIRPGAACLGAVWQGRPWLGLSGHPAAAATQCDFLLRPLLAALTGRRDTLLTPVPARLATSSGPPCPVRRLLRCRLAWEGGRLVASTDLAQQSTVLSSLVAAHGYAEVPASTALAPGDPVRVWVRPGALPAPVDQEAGGTAAAAGPSRAAVEAVVP